MATIFVLMAGLPGTGKSTLAEALAAATGGIVLSKDTIRAALFPGALTDYSEEQDDLCFRALLQAAIYIATHTGNWNPDRRYIFLDGRTFRKRSQIQSAIEAADEAHSERQILHLTCPDQIAIARITGDRSARRHLAANRDERLYLESKSSFEPIDFPHLDVDTSSPLGDCVESCLAYLAADQNGGNAISGMDAKGI